MLPEGQSSKTFKDKSTMMRKNRDFLEAHYMNTLSGISFRPTNERNKHGVEKVDTEMEKRRSKGQ